MEKFIYRLALVTLNNVEMMFPYYFEDKETALNVAKTYVSLNRLHGSSIFEEYKHDIHGHFCHSCFFEEMKSGRWLNFEYLYKDKRVSYIRFLAITRIALYRKG